MGISGRDCVGDASPSEIAAAFLPRRNSRGTRTHVSSGNQIYSGALGSESLGPRGAAADVQSGAAPGGGAGHAATRQAGSRDGRPVTPPHFFPDFFQYIFY